jgi:hypothetical protein
MQDRLSSFTKLRGRAVSLAVFVFGLVFVLPAYAATTTSLPTGPGHYDDSWDLVGTSTKSKAVSTNDGNTTYISETSDNSVQTFTVANAGLPTGATINSVTLYAVALGTNSGIQLRLEKSSTGSGNQNDDATHDLTSSYATYSRTLTTNPFTGSAWTLAEVNSWSVRFGVQYDDGGDDDVARVTQIYVVVNYNIPDTTAPTVTQVTPVPNPTNDTTPNFTFNTSETSTIIYGGDCSGTPSSTNVMGNKTVTFSVLSASTHSNCTVKAVDASNNSSTLSVSSFTIDTTKPVIEARDSVTVEAAGPGTSTVVNYSLPTTTDNIAVASVSCSPASGTLFALGATNVTCNATDTAGNSATPTTFSVVVQDTTGPVIAPHTNVTAEATGPTGATVIYTSPNAVDAVSGTFAATCLPASGSLFSTGTTPVICNATDGVGNAAVSTTFNVIVQDTTAPTITLINSSVMSLNVGDIYNEAGATATDLVDGDVTANILITGSVNTASPGVYPLVYTVTDAAGNMASTTRTVTVSDEFAPVINVISDITAEATSSAGVAVDYGVITATEEGNEELLATICNPVSGSVFPLGSTPVICQATDSFGNTRFGTALTVTVQDTTNPEVIIDPSSQTINSSSTAGAEAFFTASATDLVDGTMSSVSCTPESGSVFPFGLTTITCSTTDEHGNTGTGTATVTVLDTGAPVIILNGDATINLTVGGLYIEQGASVTDNYDTELSVTIGGDVVSTSVAGTYNITYDAQDSSENNAVQKIRMVVVNVVPPPPEEGGSEGGSGGGSSGGGSVSGLGTTYVAPTPPSFGENPITVGAGLGNTSTVQLTFDVTNASWIAISETPDFSGTSWFPYSTNTTFTLSASNTVHKLYIKFRRINGGETKVQEVTVLLNSPSTLIQAVLGVKITRLNELANKLKFGNRGAEVRELQTLLKQAGYFPAKQAITGYYGPITRAAVKKYLADINKK